ncbi:hypothetical protein B9Z55_017563 [Caenorhabditis nigoni]|uniref:Peptidase M24 C-terminal domain-containing protein n=1 Tax=Caenorhabditis nigoni TaxID=1611254 RepID=A0A2G5TA44_9PELO|nr:hypothetical protein B9Z55_017563 [Caenorhabditis nigoni]
MLKAINLGGKNIFFKKTTTLRNNGHCARFSGSKKFSVFVHFCSFFGFLKRKLQEIHKNQLFIHQKIAKNPENPNFQALTLVPIQTSFLVKKLLQPEDVLWINQYHHRVLFEVGRILLNEGKLEAWEWLGKACEPI